MKIAIRADGGSKIGMGHIMRTLVLAKELAKTNDVFYICRYEEEFLSGVNKIREEGFHSITIKSEGLIDNLIKINADMLITDSYDVNENYFNETKKIFKYTGYIDDMNLYYFNVDFLINQNINAKDLKYKINDNTKLFLGAKYVMLREEFRNVYIKNIKKEVEDILITVGGSDPNNLTREILSCVKDLQYKFHVVIGPSFNYIDEFEDYEDKLDNVKLYFHANMKNLMEECDIAISACGSTLYELSALGVPTIGVIVADNQINIAKSMEEKELILNLGNSQDLTKERLIYKLNELINNYELRKIMSKKQQKFIDKHGVLKLANEINKLTI